jgi:hypothetical protein
LSWNPGDTLDVSGPWGGPFSPASTPVSLLNLSGASLDWTASAADSTVSNGSGGFLHPIQVSPASGTIAASGSAPLTISPTADAGLLPPGVYNILVTANDTTNATSRNLLVVLYVLGVDTFRFSTIPGPQTAGIPFLATITALDFLSETVSAFSGAAGLSGEYLGASQQSTLGSTVSGWLGPLGTLYETGRLQSFYQASELGLGACSIESLGIYVKQAPSPTLMRNWTIRMKHTALGANPFQQWETDGWTVVYSGDVSIESLGWQTFAFQTPFDYDGASNVLIDFSFMNNVLEWNADGVVGTFNTGDYRSIVSGRDNIEGFGSPLAWSGTTPSYSDSKDAPSLRLSYRPVMASGAVSPASTTAFVNGVWTGNVAVAGGAGQFRLKADDGSGNIGRSNLFDVAQNLLEVWADFAWGGQETGEQATPYNTLAEALSTVQAGGTIKIKAGAGAETPRIVKQVRIEAAGGTARIGVAP